MKEISQNDWFIEVTCSETPVGVAFFADWSPSCRNIELLLEKYDSSIGKMKFVKVDVDRNMELRISQRVIVPPTLIFYYKGVPISGIPGPQPEHVYSAKIARAVRLYENRLSKRTSWSPTKA